MSRGLRTSAIFAGLACLASCGGQASDEVELVIAAAANLQPALDELSARFERDHPDVKVKITYGASGNLFAQIQNGAPYDVFLSADTDLPSRLAASGMAGDERVYASGRLVLWASEASGLDPARRGLGTLMDESVRKIAIANPRHAPYGRAAMEAMQSAGIDKAVAPRLVIGESVVQAAHFVESGAADVGFIGLSLALTPAMRDAGRCWEVPPEMHRPLDHGAVVLAASRHPVQARAFVDALGGPHARAVLVRHGYGIPEP